MRCMLPVGLLLSLVAATLADPPAFKDTPTAARAGDKIEITFAMAGPTDVEVAIIDGSGTVVRHLAAGALGGEKIPPAPLVPGLAQKLAWDGKDDFGKPVADSAGCKVRVRGGMKPQLDGFLLENPSSTGSINALAVGPKGSLYVFHRDATDAHWGSTKIKILSRDGGHVRAVTPFPADIDPDRIKSAKPFRTEQGDLVPRIHDLLRLNFYCKYSESFWRVPAQCAAVENTGRAHWLVLGPAVASIDADGGLPYNTLTGPKLLADIKGLTMASQYFIGRSRPCLAISGDGKFLYFAGLTTGNPDHKEPIKGVPCVFRVPLDTRDKAEPLLGKLDSPGTEKDLLTGPRGLAVANGLIYVADFDADRVAVFHEKDCTLAGEIKIKAPDTVGVDAITGAVYVCSGANVKTPELVKFENYTTGRELFRMALPTYRYAGENGIAHRIVVDASAKPVRIWLPTIPYTANQLLCIEDAGDKFVSIGDPRSNEPAAQGPRDITYDRLRGELYVKSGTQHWFRLDEKTGKVTFEFKPRGISHRPEYGTQLVCGEDGNLYTYSWSGKEAGLRLYDRDGKPTNWPGRDSNHIPLPGVMDYMQRGLAVRGDELFIVPPGNWRTDSGGGGVEDGTTSLNVYGLDGEVKRTLVWQCLKGAILRMDRQGNIYLADMIKPPDRLFPSFFDGKVDHPPSPTGVNDDRFYYSYMYGSIVKFPPTGGAIWYNEKVGPYVEGKPPADMLAQPKTKVQYHLGYKSGLPAELQGALWYHFGFAPYTATFSSCYRTCMCEGGGFDVDAYGRVFLPNLAQFRVEVLDTNGQPITTFGQYGNQDSRGPGSLVAKPAIPLAWPINVVVSDTHAYVADTLNRRLVKVKLDWAVEQSCDLRQGVVQQ